MKNPNTMVWLLLVPCILLLCHEVMADERILSYHSNIEIKTDASMTVTETIIVRAEGKKIRRGIFRDFPTHYQDRFKNAYNVSFKVLSVYRDEQQESWHSETKSNGVRIYIGRRDRELKPGTYKYEISYRTDRQIGYFLDHDELYWNVTGNGWDFPIDIATAHVSFPTQPRAKLLSMAGYVGALGSVEQAFTTQIADGQAEISATRPLEPREGLTLVTTFPKGLVSEPSKIDQFLFLMADNIGLLVALLLMLASSLYLFWIWRRVGRDPAPGLIFAHYEAPSGFSPASARYISKMSYDNGAFSAAIVNLAVNGHLTISESDGAYTLIKQGSEFELAAGEQTLMRTLFKHSPSLALDRANHETIAKARASHKQALERDYANRYFLTNAIHIWPSVVVSIIGTLLIGWLGAFSFFAGLVLVILSLQHVAYIFLLKAPTKRGRILLDRLEGFKLYLEVAEKDDLQLANPPQMTPALFEKFLPYAIALGVEQAWAEQFTAVLEHLSAQNNAYTPTWYQGHFNHHQLSDFTESVSSRFDSAIASAATPPGSTSGGGGFSGGGGGGGGGGGW